MSLTAASTLFHYFYTARIETYDNYIKSAKQLGEKIMRPLSKRMAESRAFQNTARLTATFLPNLFILTTLALLKDASFTPEALVESIRTMIAPSALVTLYSEPWNAMLAAARERISGIEEILNNEQPIPASDRDKLNRHITITRLQRYVGLGFALVSPLIFFETQAGYITATAVGATGIGLMYFAEDPIDKIVGQYTKFANTRFYKLLNTDLSPMAVYKKIKLKSEARRKPATTPQNFVRPNKEARRSNFKKPRIGYSAMKCSQMFSL